MRIFLAGASGAIGRRLTPLLLAAGHTVTGTTRSLGKVEELKARGIEAVVVDVFDAAALRDAVLRARPDVVIHQLTDLPQTFDRERLAASLVNNARLRIDGTDNLVAASLAAGARRLIAQSIAFAYAAGPEPHRESDPLASAEGDSPEAISARGVRALENAVVNARGMVGIVLRYGRLYGPGTWNTPTRGRRCMWMPQRMRRSSPSPAARRASTTLPRTTVPSQSKKPAASLASIRPSGWQARTACSGSASPSARSATACRLPW